MKVSAFLKDQMLKVRLVAINQLKDRVQVALNNADAESILLSDLHIVQPIVVEHLEDDLNDVITTVFIADGILCFEVDDSTRGRDIDSNDAEIDLGILIYLLEEFENIQA